MRLTHFFLVVSLGLTMFLLARCDLGDQPDPCQTDTALFQDDFENENECGWLLFDNSGLAAEILDGAMLITTSQAGKITWSNAERDFTNVIINVTARQISGPNNNAYGVICRYRDEQNFYLFLVSGDGYYTIGKYEASSPQIQYLTPNDEFGYSDIINQGVATNEIRAACVGNELSLAVNGIPVFATTDGTHTHGDIGVGASTLEPGTAQIRFDDFSVLEP